VQEEQIYIRKVHHNQISERNLCRPDAEGVLAARFAIEDAVAVRPTPQGGLHLDHTRGVAARARNDPCVRSTGADIVDDWQRPIWQQAAEKAKQRLTSRPAMYSMVLEGGWFAELLARAPRTQTFQHMPPVAVPGWWVARARTPGEGAFKPGAGNMVGNRAQFQLAR
jgi:hypothetical protein